MSESQPSVNRRRLLLRRFWRTARGFWSGRTRRIAWALTGGVGVLIGLQIYISYRLNVWNRAVFDALEQKDGGIVLTQSLLFIPLCAASIVVAVLIVYARMRLQRRWRARLTEELIDHWVAKGRYYQLNIVEGDHKNPEHRIGEDARIATESPADFGIGITTAVLTAVTFIGVLWSVGGGLTLDWSGGRIVIPGFLVIAVVVYCAMISGGMFVLIQGPKSIVRKKF